MKQENALKKRNNLVRKVVWGVLATFVLGVAALIVSNQYNEYKERKKREEIREAFIKNLDTPNKALSQMKPLNSK